MKYLDGKLPARDLKMGANERTSGPFAVLSLYWESGAYIVAGFKGPRDVVRNNERGAVHVSESFATLEAARRFASSQHKAPPAPKDPKAYLTSPNTRGRVQVIQGAMPLAEGSEAEMRTYFRRTFPTLPLVRYQDGRFAPIRETIEDINADSLWESNGGELCCVNHIGFAARGVLERQPQGQRLETPLGVWYRVGSTEAREYRNKGWACIGYHSPCSGINVKQGEAS